MAGSQDSQNRTHDCGSKTSILKEECAIGMSLLKSLELKLCPKFISKDGLHTMRIELLQLLDCPCIRDSSSRSHLGEALLNQSPHSIGYSTEDHYLSCLKFTVADLMNVAQLSETADYRSDVKYSCISSEKMNPRMIIIGVLTPQNDGSIYLEDQTGSLCCASFCGSRPLTKCSFNHKRGIGWSVNCLVVVANFYLLVEKRIDRSDDCYLIINENEIIPLTKPLFFDRSAGTCISSNLAECLNDLRITENIGSLLQDEELLSSECTHMGNLIDSFNKLLLKQKEDTSTQSVSSSPSECSNVNAVLGQSANAAVPHDDFYVCQLIVPCKKILPSVGKNGKMGFRIEILIVSSIYVEDADGNVWYTVADGAKNQALEFSDVSYYGRLHCSMVYLFKRPFYVLSVKHFRNCVRKAICSAILNVTDSCQFIPFAEAAMLCQIHNSEEEELLQRIQGAHFRIEKTVCLCSLLECGVYTVSAPTLPKFACTRTSFSVKGRIESKENLHRYQINSLCNTDIKLCLVDSSSKINLYLKCKSSEKLLFGLIPGSEVIVFGVRCRLSKNGNHYLEPSNGDVSLQLLSYSPHRSRNAMPVDDLPILPEETKKPLYFFSQLNEKHVRQFRSMSCIIKITSLSIEPSDPPASKACFLADDGSDQLYVTCCGNTVAQLLGIDSSEWDSLLHFARSFDGELRFKSYSGWQKDPIISFEMQFLQLLCQRSEVHRQMILHCKSSSCDSDSNFRRNFRVFCIGMYDAKAVKLPIELLGHITTRICT